MKKVFLVSAFLIAVSSVPLFAQQEAVVAVVNKEVITKGELDAYVRKMKMQLGDERWKQYGLNSEQVLDNLIEERLLVQEAKAKDIKPDEREVDSRVEDFRKNFKTELEFSHFLVDEGLSLDELKNRFREQILSDALITTMIRHKISVSPSEVSDFYNQHEKEFLIPDQADVESIYVSKKEDADKIYTQLQSGADFGQLQKDNSKKSNLGMVEKGQLRADLDSFIFNLQKGEIGKPLETAEGYYIFRIKELTLGHKKSLIDAQPRIHSFLMERKFSERFKEYIGQLKSKAYIKIIYG